MAFCSSVSKTILFTINIIFWICAAFLTYSAIHYLNLTDGIASFPHEKPAQILLVAAGVFFVCGLIGIVATVWENKCILGMFIIIIFATLVLLFGGMIVMVVGYSAAETAVDDHFTNEYNRYDKNITKLHNHKRYRRAGEEVTNTTTTTATTKPTTTESTTPKPKTTTAANTTISTTTSAGKKTTTASSGTTTANISTTAVVTTVAPTTAPPTDNATKVIDELQTKHKCCGWGSYEEWNNYTAWRSKHHNYVPGSCCNSTAAKLNNMTCNQQLYNMRNKTELKIIYHEGCKSKVHDEFTNGYNFLQWTALVLGILAFFGLLATTYLALKKRNDPRELGYSSVVA